MPIGRPGARLRPLRHSANPFPAATTLTDIGEALSLKTQTTNHQLAERPYTGAIGFDVGTELQSACGGSRPT